MCVSVRETEHISMLQKQMPNSAEGERQWAEIERQCRGVWQHQAAQRSVDADRCRAADGKKETEILSLARG